MYIYVVKLLQNIISNCRGVDMSMFLSLSEQFLDNSFGYRASAFLAPADFAVPSDA